MWLPRDRGRYRPFPTTPTASRALRMCKATKRSLRPRSADLGGLCLATSSSGLGQGWLGHESELETRFAELLSDMYTETLNAVKERNTEYCPADLPEETRERLIRSLDDWGFEPHRLPDEEVFACCILLFESLFRMRGMQDAIGSVSLKQITALVFHLRQIYRWENPYHNFEHALDVLQAAYMFLKNASMVPPVTILLDRTQPEWTPSRRLDSGPLMTTLDLRDLFVIYIAAIGHDVGHPGFTNAFMKNASTPLSIVFNGKSALEHMHCSILLRVMRHHGLGELLDSDPLTRKLLWQTVMATDMSVHNDFMARFADPDLPMKDLFTRKVLVSQALIKCADISNPSRPYHVATHWAKALMGEWNSQANLEKTLELPVSVSSEDDDLTVAKGQAFFIQTFAGPLMELVASRVQEMQPYVIHCKENHQRWTDRKIALEAAAAAAEADDMERQQEHGEQRRQPPRYDDYHNTFPLTLTLTHRASILHPRPGSTSSSLQHSSPERRRRRVRKPSTASSSSAASVATSYSSASAFSGSSSEGEDSSYPSSTYVTTMSSPASPQSELEGFRFDVKDRAAGTSTMSTTSEYHECEEGEAEDEQGKYAPFRAAAAKASGWKTRLMKCEKRNSWAGGGTAAFQRMTDLAEEESRKQQQERHPMFDLEATPRRR